MSRLEAFFADKADKIENEFFAVSPRFKNQETGEPIPWELKPLNEKEVSDIRKRCRKKIKGKYGQFTEETDSEAVSLKMVTESVVFPNLKDQALQQSYQVIGAEELLKIMLKSGEYGELLLKVQEISGYDQDMNELVEEAKN